MDNISQRFVNKLYRMSGETFPRKVTEKARECFCDYLFVTFAGSKMYKEIQKRFLEENRVTGSCRVIGQAKQADVCTAAMLNAFNAHVLELDDSHRVAMTHLGAPVFSALLGAAQLHEVALDEMLHAAVIGYEASIRLANAIQPSHKLKGFHVSGTCCTVGCAMGIAAMLGYSEQEMQNVLSAAATSAAGLLGVASGKSQQKPYNTANAAYAGVNAALFGRYFSGAVDILGGPRGFFEAFSDEVHPEKLFEDGYAIETIYQKLYAACRHCHAPMEAMLTLVQSNDLQADDISAIEVRTYNLAIGGHDHTQIVGVSSAKQSIPYAVAAACVFRDCGMNAFTPERVADATVLSLTKRVRVAEDPALSALVPDKRAARVNVVMRDGKRYSAFVDYAKGEPEAPITKDEFDQKFRSLADFAGMTDNEYDHIISFLDKCGNKPAGAVFDFTGNSSFS